MNDLQRYDFLNKNTYVRFFSTSNKHCIPLVCAYEKTSQNKYPVGPRRPPNYVVHFVLDGEGFFLNNDEKIKIPTGSIFAIKPEETITYMQNPDKPWRTIWFEINGISCASLFESAGLNKNVIIHKVSEYNKFKYMFLNMVLDCQHKDDSNGFIFLSNMYKIFDAISTELNTKKQENNNENQLFNEIIKYVNKEFSDICSSKEIAEKFYISPQYLARIFKKEIKVSPLEYLNNLKLEKAASMLAHGNFSISSISESLGFSSPYYFSIAFKKKYSASPKLYRRLYQYQQEEKS